MKFNEKLSTLRKEKNMSQEDLADKLGVSRQSVSKWESANAYPEMDKLLTLCKIFNVTLEELTNDDISLHSENKKDSSFSDTINKYFNKIINYIKNINLNNNKDILKIIIPIIILMIFSSSIFIIIDNISLSIHYNSMFKFIINIIFNMISLSLIVLLVYYIYKIFVNNKEVINKDSKNITDNIAKNTSYIVKVLAKLLLIIIIIPIILILISMYILLFINIYILINNVNLYGTLILFIGIIILLTVLIYVLTSLVLDHKLKYAKYIILTYIGIILSSLGVVTTLLDINSIEYIDKIPENIKVTKEYKYYNKDTIINNNFNTNYYIDNTLDNIKVEIIYNENYSALNINNYIFEDKNHITFHIEEINQTKIFNLIIDNLKEKKFYNYDKLFDYTINIYSNEETINKIRWN